MNLKEIFASRLRNTVQQCQLRGLYQASQWASEQLMGLEPDDTTGNGNLPSIDATVPVFSSELEQVHAKEVSVIMLSFSLIAQGQFQRCAYNLRRYGQDRSKLSKLGLFIYAYSHYMAGEKLKTQQNQSDKHNTTLDNLKVNGSKPKISAEAEPIKVFNLNLPDLYKELLPFYIHNQMDGYLLYIFAIITRDLFRSQGRNVRDVLGLNQDSLDPCVLFQQAIVANPWNWSCWMEFEVYCMEQQVKIPTWDEMMVTATTYRFHHTPTNSNSNNNSSGCGPVITVEAVDKQCGRAIYAFFLSHYYIEQHRGELALPALEKLMKIFPTSLFLIAHTAVAHYTQRTYDVAEDHFLTLRTKDPYRLQHIDTYSNILYVHEKATELSLLAHHLVQIDKFAPEVCCVIGNHYSLRGQHEKAVTYFQRALRSSPGFASAWTLLGHEYMELRNTVAAIQCYRHGAGLMHNVKIIVDDANSTNNNSTNNIVTPLQPHSPGDFRAWYGLGQTYEMLHCHQYALYYYQKAAALRPDDARMWSAVGNSFLRLHLKTAAMASLERAVYDCADQEGVATRDLARLYKEEASLSNHNSTIQTNSSSNNSNNKTIFMQKAANTYYLFLLISNQTNNYNLWSMECINLASNLTRDEDADIGEGGVSSLVFPPVSLDAFFSIVRQDHNHQQQHPLYPILLAGDDFLSLHNSNAGSHTSNSMSNNAQLLQMQQQATSQVLSGFTVDAEQAEALLFLASYCQAMKESVAAQYFSSRLLSYTGPEGDQARMMLRELRAKPASYLFDHNNNNNNNNHNSYKSNNPDISSSFIMHDQDNTIRFAEVAEEYSGDFALNNSSSRFLGDEEEEEDDIVLPSSSGARRHHTPNSINRRQSSMFLPSPSTSATNSTSTNRR